jgi:hypothetical protein
MPAAYVDQLNSYHPVSLEHYAHSSKGASVLIPQLS